MSINQVVNLQTVGYTIFKYDDQTIENRVHAEGIVLATNTIFRNIVEAVYGVWGSNVVAEKMIYSKKGFIAEKSQLQGIISINNVYLTDTTASTVHSIQGRITWNNIEKKTPCQSIVAMQKVELHNVLCTGRAGSWNDQVIAKESSLHYVFAKTMIELIDTTAETVTSEFGGLIATNCNLAKVEAYRNVTFTNTNCHSLLVVVKDRNNTITLTENSSVRGDLVIKMIHMSFISDTNTFKLIIIGKHLIQGSIIFSDCCKISEKSTSEGAVEIIGITQQYG